MSIKVIILLLVVSVSGCTQMFVTPYVKTCYYYKHYNNQQNNIHIGSPIVCSKEPGISVGIKWQ